MISGDPPLATLHELGTVYGVGDLYAMLEVMAINARNARTVEEWRRRKRRDER